MFHMHVFVATFERNRNRRGRQRISAPPPIRLDESDIRNEQTDNTALLPNADNNNYT